MGRTKSHDPSRPRASTRRRRRVKVGHVPTVEVFMQEKVDAINIGLPDTAHAAITRSLLKIAPLLWASDYKPILADEMAALHQMGVLEKHLEAKASVPPSSYTQRGLIRNKEKKAEKILGLTRDDGAMSLRQANQQIYPFSICARSVSMYMRRMSSKDWAELLAKKMVLSRPTTVKLIKFMMKCIPGANFATMPKSIMMVVYDQCYKKKGESRGKHRAAERVVRLPRRLRTAQQSSDKALVRFPTLGCKWRPGRSCFNGYCQQLHSFPPSVAWRRRNTFLDPIAEAAWTLLPAV